MSDDLARLEFEKLVQSRDLARQQYQILMKYGAGDPSEALQVSYALDERLMQHPHWSTWADVNQREAGEIAKRVEANRQEMAVKSDYETAMTVERQTPWKPRDEPEPER